MNEISTPAERPIYQDLSKFTHEPGFRGRSGVTLLIWQIVESTLFSWSPQPAFAWRRWLLRLFGAKVGRSVKIRPTARVAYPWKVIIGDNAWIGDHAEIYSLGPIEIGENAVVSQRSYICAGSHDYKRLSFPLVAHPIKIEAEAWIATDCFIAPGVTIGRGAIVAARSTVLADVPEAAIVAGTPAVRKGTRLPAADDTRAGR